MLFKFWMRVSLILGKLHRGISGVAIENCGFSCLAAQGKDDQTDHLVKPLPVCNEWMGWEPKTHGKKWRLTAFKGVIGFKNMHSTNTCCRSLRLMLPFFVCHRSRHWGQNARPRSTHMEGKGLVKQLMPVYLAQRCATPSSPTATATGSWVRVTSPHPSAKRPGSCHPQWPEAQRDEEMMKKDWRLVVRGHTFCFPNQSHKKVESFQSQTFQSPPKKVVFMLDYSSPDRETRRMQSPWVVDITDSKDAIPKKLLLHQQSMGVNT